MWSFSALSKICVVKILKRVLLLQFSSMRFQLNFVESMLMGEYRLLHSGNVANLKIYGTLKIKSHQLHFHYIVITFYFHLPDFIWQKVKQRIKASGSLVPIHVPVLAS